MELRPYQRAALEAVRAAYRRGRRRVLVVMPTGTGKTVLFAEIARIARGPVLVLAHRQELVEQARAKMAAWCEDVVAVEMAGRRGLTRPDGGPPRIAVASVQTLGRRLGELPPDHFRLIVVDEAHHAAADSYRGILEHFRAHVLGVTATPDRSDRVSLGEVFEEVAFEYDLRRAIADGWLAPIRSFFVETKADFTGVRKVAGELSTADVERVLTKEPHLVEVARPILRERGDRPAIVFAASVAHSRALARVLSELAGDPRFAVSLDGTHQLETRARAIERFRRRGHQVLVNCALFTEGFDVPEISLVAVARPVLSRPFYAQMVGRGTRLAPGKNDLLVLDFAPQNCRHSLVHATDLLAGDSEEVAERARAIAAKAGAEGSSIALEKALELARQEQEAAEADVVYQLRRRDPFAAGGVDHEAIRRAPRGGGAPTPEQLASLKRVGLPPDLVDGLDERQVEAVREHLRERKAVGLCTPRQARQLVQLGIDPRDLYADHAKELLREAREGARGAGEG